MRSDDRFRRPTLTCGRYGRSWRSASRSVVLPQHVGNASIDGVAKKRHLGLVPRGPSGARLSLSRIQRVSCETGDAHDLPAVAVGVASGDRWSGVRVQQMLGNGPGEFSESYFQKHILTVGAYRRFEANWVDGASFADPDEGPASMVLVFPAMQPFRASWDSVMSGTFIELSPELVSEAMGAVGGATRAELRPGAATDDHFIAPLASALVDLAARDELATTLLAELLGLAIATHLGQTRAGSHQMVSTKPGTMSPRKVRLLESFVDSRLDSQISLRALAAQADLSMFHFARCFRKSTGMTPHQFVTRQRIERARELLRNPNLSVANVALRCGFSQPSHFSEVFRRVVGSSPRQYRGALGVAASGRARIR